MDLEFYQTTVYRTVKPRSFRRWKTRRSSSPWTGPTWRQYSRQRVRCFKAGPNRAPSTATEADIRTETKDSPTPALAAAACEPIPSDAAFRCSTGHGAGLSGQKTLAKLIFRELFSRWSGWSGPRQRSPVRVLLRKYLSHNSFLNLSGCRGKDLEADI